MEIENQIIKELLLQIGKGEETAIVEFGKIIGPRIRAIVFTVAGNLNDLDDIVQEVFISILKNAGLISYEKNLKNWVYKIVKNKTIDNYRRKKTFGEPIELEKYQDHFDEERVDTLLTIRQVVAKLDAKDRYLLALRFISDLKFEEIAEIVHRSPAWIHKRLKKIYEIIRKN